MAQGGWGGGQQGGYQPPQGYPPQQYALPVPQQCTCTWCGFTGTPAVVRKTSTTGWIVFALLLPSCFILCWLGLLMREDVRMCPACGRRIVG